MRTLLRIGAPFLAALSLVAADKQWAGTYVGDWHSNAGSAKGSFQITLSSPSQGKWQAEVMFTMGDTEVKTTVKSLQIEESKIEVSYEFDLIGNRLLSTIHGQLAGSKLEGTYHTTTVPDGVGIDEGAWTATGKR